MASESSNRSSNENLRFKRMNKDIRDYNFHMGMAFYDYDKVCVVGRRNNMRHCK